MKNYNKGFSLVELIVAVAMFTIVGAMVVSFVAISSKTYRNVSAEVDVQEEAQLTLNQIKDLVIDTNRAVSYGLEAPDPSNMKSFTPVDVTNTEASIINTWVADGVNEDYIKRVLVIYSEKSLNTTQADGTVVTSYTYPIVKIIYDKNKSEIYYAENEFPDTSLIDVSSFGVSASDIYLLSKYVTDFSVDLANIEDSQVNLQVNFSSASEAGVGREYLATPTINLRNKVIVSEIVSDIYTNNGVEMNSFVLGIDIKKNDVVIHGDTIQLGSMVTYTAEVDAQYGASEAYTWNLTGDNAGFSSTVSGTGQVSVPMDEPSGTLTLTAIAVGDSTKTASIPITISGELRPTNISISTSETGIIGNADAVRKIYTFTAITTYTDGSTTIGENITWTSPTNLPIGAYTSVSASGQLLLYLKANGGLQEYDVSVQANDLNIAGGVVSAIETVLPGDLSYVDPSIMEVVITPNLDSISRGDPIVLTANVSDFTGNEENLNYTWEILDAESVGFSGTGNNGIGNVTLSEESSTGDQKELEINKNLNWSSEFVLKVKVTAYDDVAGEVQSDSYVASFTILPVSIEISSTNNTKIKDWIMRETFYFSANNIKLTTSDWYDVDFEILFSGIDYYSGDTIENSDISSDKISFDRINKIASGRMSRDGYSGGYYYYIITGYVQLEVEYNGSFVTSEKLLIKK